MLETMTVINIALSHRRVIIAECVGNPLSALLELEKTEGC